MASGTESDRARLEAARAAVRQEAEQRALAAVEPQPALFDDADLGLPASVALAGLQDRRRGPGRPPGSRNRRAEDAARTCIELLGDPLVMLVALAMTPVDELVAAGLTVHEAIVEKRQSARDALPYLHQRKPQAIDVTGLQVVHLTIGDVPGGGGEVVEIAAADFVEIQQVSEGAPAPVAHDPVAHAG